MGVGKQMEKNGYIQFFLQISVVVNLVSLCQVSIFGFMELYMELEVKKLVFSIKQIGSLMRDFYIS